ncbi:hypothetical protein FOZ63_004207 [Perkinsus olseni]|uniref:Transmembrane protein 134 n=1 Tax=Perkinsus olseni TaxID=32597 RepID=A0A7J6R3A1_PEROL|nr:hypothetical protein FOZ63_004207 [Perkinsus olseni]KAF4744992.1 hypothetical protein FOZ62_006991 [Perkinsus olseni]
MPKALSLIHGNPELPDGMLICKTVPRSFKGFDYYEKDPNGKAEFDKWRRNKEKRMPWLQKIELRRQNGFVVNWASASSHSDWCGLHHRSVLMSNNDDGPSDYTAPPPRRKPRFSPAEPPPLRRPALPRKGVALVSLSCSLRGVWPRLQAFFLFIIGVVFLLTGLRVFWQISTLEAIPFTTLGAICFIPGAYHVYLIYHAYMQTPGFDYTLLDHLKSG